MNRTQKRTAGLSSLLGGEFDHAAASLESKEKTVEPFVRLLHPLCP